MSLHVCLQIEVLPDGPLFIPWHLMVDDLPDVQEPSKASSLYHCYEHEGLLLRSLDPTSCYKVQIRITVPNVASQDTSG